LRREDSLSIYVKHITAFTVIKKKEYLTDDELNIAQRSEYVFNYSKGCSVFDKNRQIYRINLYQDILPCHVFPT